MSLPANRADHFKAAQVRTHQKQAIAVGKQAAQRVLAVHFKIEQIEAAVDQIDTVMNGGGKGEKMPVQIAPVGRTT